MAKDYCHFEPGLFRLVKCYPLRLHPCYCKWQNLLPFESRNIFCISLSLFTHPLRQVYIDAIVLVSFCYNNKGTLTRHSLGEGRVDLTYTFRSSPSLREIKVETQAETINICSCSLPSHTITGSWSESYLAQAYLPGDGNTTVGWTLHHQ